jgi:hypothetical protein
LRLIATRSKPFWQLLVDVIKNSLMSYSAHEKCSALDIESGKAEDLSETAKSTRTISGFFPETKAKTVRSSMA